jgi:hypothetical protein
MNYLFLLDWGIFDIYLGSSIIYMNIPVVPRKVFIVPYRNRPQHKYFFSSYMPSVVLKNMVDYEIYFSHQSDSRSFNRGAVKNIGFLAIKEKYPEHYQDITFIFNDIDTMPFTTLFTYDTTPGTVKHYYGFTYALGGIVVIKGKDFEQINGYPCFWGWGHEDNCLQTRCNAHGILIDRSDFYPIGNPNILQLFDGITRLIIKNDAWRGKHDSGEDGLSTIRNIRFVISAESDNVKDQFYVISHKSIWYVNIKEFDTLINPDNETFHSYDLRDPPIKIIQPNQVNMVIPKDNYNNSYVNSPNNWSHIPPHEKFEVAYKRTRQIVPELIERPKTHPSLAKKTSAPTPDNMIIYSENKSGRGHSKLLFL